MMRDALRKLDLMTVNREPALYLGSPRRARPLLSRLYRPCRSSHSLHSREASAWRADNRE